MTEDCVWAHVAKEPTVGRYPWSLVTQATNRRLAGGWALTPEIAELRAKTKARDLKKLFIGTRWLTPGVSA